MNVSVGPAPDLRGLHTPPLGAGGRGGLRGPVRGQRGQWEIHWFVVFFFEEEVEVKPEKTLSMAVFSAYGPPLLLIGHRSLGRGHIPHRKVRHVIMSTWSIRKPLRAATRLRRHLAGPPVRPISYHKSPSVARSDPTFSAFPVRVIFMKISKVVVQGELSHPLSKQPTLRRPYCFLNPIQPGSD